MSSSSAVDFALLNQAINRYVPIPFLFFGIIGNIFNILVFTRRFFRHNICVTFFLGLTAFDFLAIIVGLLPRLLNGFGYDLSQTSAILCKLRFFITYHSGSTAGWFIGLACVERYLSSSRDVHRRQLITVKRAYLSMVAVIILGFLAYGEQFYCIDINQKSLGAPQSCYQLQQNIACQIADSLLQLFFEILSPAVMMIVFGLLTFGNIREKNRRIHAMQAMHMHGAPVMSDSFVGRRQPIHSVTNLSKTDRTKQKRDAQLITMLFVQVVVFILFSSPIGVFKLYSFATISTPKSTLRTSIENTVFNIAVICVFVNNSITFYIYTLSGAVFRKELMKLLHLS